MPRTVTRWLDRFNLDQALHPHALAVVAAMPQPVRSDLMDDPNFIICDYDPDQAAHFQIPLGLPTPGNGSRSVVLKRTLTLRSAAFIRWLIAHELAHAHLHNNGRFPGDDPEHAADALAAQWGFPRPATP